MCPSAVYSLLVVFLALHSASHGEIAADKRHGSLTFDPEKVFSTKLIGTPKTRPYNKPQDVMEKIRALLGDSSKPVKVHPPLSFPIDGGHQHPSHLQRHHHERAEVREQISKDIGSSVVDNEETDVKGFERKERDESISRYEKSRELAEEPHLQKRTIDNWGQRKREESMTSSSRRRDVLSSGGNRSEGWFPCGPNQRCVCNARRADCTGLRLSEFPLNLPRGVRIIDASYNKITSLSISLLNSVYQHLLEADLSFNLITQLDQFSTNVNYPLNVLNLDSNKLQKLPNVTFVGLVNLRELYLSNNNITVIKDQLFSNMTNLQTLDLSYNSLTTIENKAFDSLVKLRTLRLDNNKDLGYSNATFHGRLFKNLKVLRHLWIQGNANETKDKSYPNEALAHLTNLIELNIDGLAGGVEFGYPIGKLSRLHALVFGFQGNCFINKLSSSFFQHVPYLLKLTFVGCPFQHIENGTFEKLHKLVNYTLAFPASNYDFRDALKDLQGLPNTSLTALALIGFMKGKTKCRTLSGEDIKYIGRFHLHSLYLNFNYISYVEDEFIQGIPRTLQKLYLRGNKFTFIDYRWNFLMNFTNIYEIDIRDQNMYPSVPPESQWFGGEISHHSNPYVQNVRKIPPKDLPGEDRMDIDFVQRRTLVCFQKRREYCRQKLVDVTENLDTTSYLENSQCNPYDPRKACIPPNLNVVRASGFTEFGRALLYLNRSVNDLCYLDFSRGFFTDWGNGLLPTRVKIADFSDNFCDNIKPDFFPPENQLRYLCIDNNYLGPAFSEDVNGTIFSGGHNLKYLSIAMNNIFKLPAAFFKGLKSLEILDMYENKLQILDVDFFLTPNLREIDLSGNSITWITRRSRRGLDTLAVNHSIFMNLLYNPLPCSCEGVEVLQWLANTRVILKYKRFLTCNSETVEKMPLGDIKKRIKSLNRKCIPNSDLIILSSFSCSIFILVILCGLLYKNRWKLIYARNVWLVNMYGFRPMGRGRSHRLYDAYVVYSEEDRDFVLNTMIEELEGRRGHKLCVEDRDFVPGNFNFNNVTCAIQNSTITLLLLSPDFVSTRGELEYATQMALMEQHNGQDRRDVILLFRYTEISTEKLTKDLLTLMKQGRFLDYPKDQDESIKQRFWDRVSAEIGHTQNTNAPDLLLNTE